MSSKPANDLQRMLGELGEEQTKAIVTMLAAIYEGKSKSKSMVPAVTPPPLTDLLYKLATIHTETVKKLAVLSEEHTAELVKYMKARKNAQTTDSCETSPDLPQVLAVMEGARGSKVAAGKFTIRNKSNQKRIYEMAEVVEFRNVHVKDAGTVFVNVQVAPEKMEIPGASGSQNGRKEFDLTIQLDSRLGPGTYRAMTHLTQAGAAELELIIELLVQGS